MNNPIMKLHGKYRILPHLDSRTKDFPRDEFGEIDDSYDDLYIPCKHGNEIHSAGNGQMSAYIFSASKCYALLKKAQKSKIKVIDSDVLEEEGFVVFNASDIEFFAEYLKADTVKPRLDPFNLKNMEV